MASKGAVLEFLGRTLLVSICTLLLFVLLRMRLPPVPPYFHNSLPGNPDLVKPHVPVVTVRGVRWAVHEEVGLLGIRFVGGFTVNLCQVAEPSWPIHIP